MSRLSTTTKGAPAPACDVDMRKAASRPPRWPRVAKTRMGTKEPTLVDLSFSRPRRAAEDEGIAREAGVVAGEDLGSSDHVTKQVKLTAAAPG